MDFKVSITQPLEEHGAWAEAEYNPLETVCREPSGRLRLPVRRRGPRETVRAPRRAQEFIEKLKAIEGVSQVETQEITFEAL